MARKKAEILETPIVEEVLVKPKRTRKPKSVQKEIEDVVEAIKEEILEEIKPKVKKPRQPRKKPEVQKAEEIPVADAKKEEIQEAIKKVISATEATQAAKAAQISKEINKVTFMDYVKEFGVVIVIALAAWYIGFYINKEEVTNEPTEINSTSGNEYGTSENR